MNTKILLVLSPLFFSLIIISCSKEPTEFYSKQERERIGAHEPNILFSNYHLLDADKYIELKSVIDADSIPTFEIVCSFLKNKTLKFNNQSFKISENFQTIPLPNFPFREDGKNLSFEINEQHFSFPKSKLMILSRIDFPAKIGVGSKVTWKKGDQNEKIILAIRPNHQDCGKVNSDGKTYGTIPMLIQDDGEYSFQENDFRSVGLDYKNEASIFFKRGSSKMDKFQSDLGEEVICISKISYASVEAKIK